MRSRDIKISVIVPTYNEEKNIEKFLRQFETQTLPRDEFEIIIVDGNSKDNTRKIAKKHADKVILQRSKGIGGARNDGVKVARGKIIATTDADVIIPPNWLEHILEDFERNPDVVALQGPDGPIENTLKAKIIYWIMMKIIYLAYLFGIPGTGGTNSAFRKKEFLEIGGYRYLPYSDDVDIGFRIKKLGRVLYDRRLFVRLSVRRLKQDGYSKVIWTWFIGDLKLLFGLPLKEKDYAKKEYCC